MQEININVRVQIGVTDTLCGLLSAFAKNAVPGVVAAQPTPAPAQETKPAEAAPVQQAAEVQETEAPAVEAAPVQEPAPAPAPAAAAAPEAEKELTEAGRARRYGSHPPAHRRRELQRRHQQRRLQEMAPRLNGLV